MKKRAFLKFAAGAAGARVSAYVHAQSKNNWGTASSSPSFSSAWKAIARLPRTASKPLRTNSA